MGVTIQSETPTSETKVPQRPASQSAVVKLAGVSKTYRLYDSPKDRLKEALDPWRRSRHRVFNALQNVSIEVEPREIIGIVGKNGSGKSTLLKLIAGVLQPTSGQVSVRLPVTPLLELGAGLNPELTGTQNIDLFGSLLGISKTRLQEAKAEIVEFADIGEHMSQPLKTYSSGMKSRLGFSIAVHVDPQILIVDEVLSVGDIAFQRKCYRKIEELFGRGSTVFYVSHNMQSITQLCNRALLIHQGQIVEDDSPEQVIKSYQKLIFENQKQSWSNLTAEKSIPKQREDLNKSTTDREPHKLGSRYHHEHFTPNLTSDPRSTNSDIIHFKNIRILDKSGLIVNQLNQGDRFDLMFESHFETDVSAISFGAQLQTLQGLILSGANMLANEGYLYPRAQKGAVVEVRWEFHCLLVPGNYIVKVFAAPEDGTPAAFTEDALLFQVRPQKRENGGFVYLDQQIYAKHISGLSSERDEK